MTEQADVVADLAAEGDAVDRMVAPLVPTQWTLATPAPGWTIAHQIAHLVAAFRLATLAATEPDQFVAAAATTSPNFAAYVDQTLAEHVAEPCGVLLSRWRTERARVHAALGALPPSQEVPWLVRPITASILAAVGMMELFGHGQDIADALGIRREHTDRIGHVVAFAVRAWDFGYHARGLTPPDVAFRFELTAPSGGRWEFGPVDGRQRITGPAVDFCLLVTRRRHRADLGLQAVGADADHWLDIAQAYRGPAGPGRQPGQFAAARR